MKKLFTPLLLLSLATGAQAQTWTGAASNDWFNAANWNPMTVPGSTSAVTIPGGLGTYPALTGNVTIAGLAMSSGSALHLGGNAFTDNGDVSVITATIDGGGSFSVAGAGTVNVSSSTISATASITGYTGVSTIYNNSFTGNTTISDATSQANSNNYIDGNLFTGNLNITHASATAEMDQGYGAGGPGDHVTGNCTITLSGGGSFFAAFYEDFKVDGNLTVNRTAAGYTNLYRNLGNIQSMGNSAIGGSFSYTNNTGGEFYLNNTNAVTLPVGGTVNITSATPDVFHMYRVKNNIAGGTVSVANSGNLDVRNDTLKAITAFTGYTGPAFFYNNSLTGNATISDDASQANGNNSIDGNLFAGNLSITHASATAEMDQGYGAGGAGDHVTGNCTIALTGGGSFYVAYYEDFKVDGNLTVNRTAAGFTGLYRNLGNIQSVGNSAIGGAFSYTNNVGGDLYLNNTNSVVLPVGGTVNITSNSTGVFHMYKVKNNTPGGMVSVANASEVDIQNDTLNATAGFTAYTGPAHFYNNSITGNTTITDAASQANSNNYIDGNLFTGSLNITHASTTAEMDQGYGAGGPGDHVTGNCTITLSGGGSFYVAYSEDFKVDGNLTLNRTAAGYTSLYRNLGNSQSVGNSGIGGSFSYTNNVGGDFYLNNNNAVTLPVAGNINIASTVPNTFHMYRVKNTTPGGSVSVANASEVDIQNDTLNATAGFTAYTGPAHFYNNSITGNTTITDAASQANSNNYIDGNLFTGNLNITHASTTAEMDQGYGAGGPGDHVTGNCTITLSGGGSFYVAYSEDFKVDGNLTLNRTAAGFTSLYRNLGNSQSAGNAAIGGAFSYTNNVGGDFYLNNNNAAVLPINGAVNIASTSPGIFHMYKVRGSQGGGSIAIANSGELDMRNDTLTAATGITAYAGSLLVYDNALTGATLIADAAAQSNGNNNIDGNLFAGRFTLVHSSANASLYAGYGSPTGNINVVTGRDSIVNLSGAATLYLSYSRPHRADSTFVLASAAGTNISDLIFGGSTGGALRNTGAQALSIPNITMMKTGGATLTLQAPLTVTNALTFSTGYLATTAANPLSFANGAVQSGAGNASHVTGPVIKVGAQAFTFPLGNGAYYSPAGITAPANATDAFTAQYYPVQPNAAGYDSSLHDASINHISRREYWTIDRSAGTSNVQVTLGYNQPSSGQVTAMSQLTVAHWYNNGTSLAWHDEGNGGTTGTTGLNAMGTVTSNNVISSFSPFTIASTTIANPLPVVLSDFSARRSGSTALLEWVIQSENNIAGFDIQHSADGSSWKDIGTVASTGNSAAAHTYQYTDAEPLAGKNFYRLRIKDYSAAASYSAVRMVLMDGPGGDEIAVYPNPVSTLLHVSGGVKTVTLSDATGKIMYTGVGDIDMEGMAAGVYLLRVERVDGGMESFRVVRR